MAGTACQPATQNVRAPVAASPAPAVDSLAAAHIAQLTQYPAPTRFTAADTLTQPQLALLGQYDLSKLWCSADRPQEPTLEGFFGPDHYRFTLVLLQARRDARQPDVYAVQGKYRFHKMVQPFAGTLTIRRVRAIEAPNAPDMSELLRPRELAALRRKHPGKDPGPPPCYQLVAQLQLTETGLGPPGTLEGEAWLACYLAPHRASGYVMAAGDISPGWNSSLMLRGTHRNGATAQTNSFTVADNVFIIAPAIYRDFVQGERTPEMNPKYNKLGWDTYWENDEWWAEPTRRHANALSLHLRWIPFDLPVVEPDSSHSL
ncbi:MAG: hypothetical protein ACRYFX_28275 [Janthinobacterium lividum]